MFTAFLAMPDKLSLWRFWRGVVYRQGEAVGGVGGVVADEGVGDGYALHRRGLVRIDFFNVGERRAEVACRVVMRCGLESN